MLTGKQIEALTELITVSIGAAADSLSEIIDTPVGLNVPDVQVLSTEDRKDLHDILSERDAYALVKQDFKGNLSGTTALAFSPGSAVKLVSLLTDTDITDTNLDIIQTGTLLEVGNIINNAFLGTLNNQFNFRVNFKLPEFNEVNISQLLDASIGTEEGLIIIANTIISIKLNDIEGHLLLLFRVAQLDYLRMKLDEMSGVR